MTFEPIEHEPDDYEDADTPARPSAGRTGAFPRRFWRTLTGQRTTGPVCRPVTVQGADGEPVHTTVLGDARAVAAFLTHFRDDPDNGVIDEYNGDVLTIGMLRRMVAALEARDAKAGEQR